MKRLSLLALVLAPVTALAIACAAPPADDTTGGSANDLSGSIGNARSCTAVNAYEGADISDFDTPADADLPGAVRNATAHASAVAVFDVKGVGKVYAAQLGSATNLLDKNGRLLAQGVDYGDHLRWSDSSNKVLSCGGSSSGGSDGGTEGGNWVPPTPYPANDGGSEAGDYVFEPPQQTSWDAAAE